MIPDFMLVNPGLDAFLVSVAEDEPGDDESSCDAVQTLVTWAAVEAWRITQGEP